VGRWVYLRPSDRFPLFRPCKDNCLGYKLLGVRLQHVRSRLMLRHSQSAIPTASALRSKRMRTKSLGRAPIILCFVTRLAACPIISGTGRLSPHSRPQRVADLTYLGRFTLSLFSIAGPWIARFIFTETLNIRQGMPPSRPMPGM